MRIQVPFCHRILCGLVITFYKVGGVWYGLSFGVVEPRSISSLLSHPDRFLPAAQQDECQETWIERGCECVAVYHDGVIDGECRNITDIKLIGE